MSGRYSDQAMESAAGRDVTVLMPVVHPAAAEEPGPEQQPAPPSFPTSSPQLNDVLIFSVIKKKPRTEFEALVRRGAEVDCLCQRTGRTPLAYAVNENDYRVVRDLIDLRADVNLVMPGGHTALKTAILNPNHDGTEMARLLLSKGAGHEGVRDVVGPSNVNVTVQYWLDQAALYPVTKKKQDQLRPFGLERLLEIYFGVIGERLAARILFERMLGHCSDTGAARGKPLVLLLPGPPGHGKTFATMSLARTLVPEDDILHIICSTLRDDADLFGSRLGGSTRGEYSSDGALVAFLRTRQAKRTVVVLDEFEKLKDLTSALGWDQAKKMYQAFLEPWQDGTLTDQGSQARAAGNKIDCSKTIFICMTNLGQKEIVEFADKHRARIYERQLHDADLAWVQKELVDKEIKPLWERYLKGVSPEMVALYRRFNGIVPFLPFTEHEQVVVADTELRSYLQRYRDPPVLDDSVPLEKRRMVGNLIVHNSLRVARLAAKAYEVYEGASSLQKYAQNVHGMLCSKELSGVLDEARRNKRNLREIWLDIVDDRVEIAFSKPSEDDDTASAAGAAREGPGVLPGAAEACAGSADVHGSGAPAQDAVGLATREMERVGEELGSYDFE
uniref:AAA+ ATPase domain-containing protein n=1 Tax=Cryptomonas curvata TaxID=233186 RepID=A0A6T7VQM6_9CRYP